MSTVLKRFPLTTTSRRRPWVCVAAVVLPSHPTNATPLSSAVLIVLPSTGAARRRILSLVRRADYHRCKIPNSWHAPPCFWFGARRTSDAARDPVRVAFFICLDTRQTSPWGESTHRARSPKEGTAAWQPVR